MDQKKNQAPGKELRKAEYITMKHNSALIRELILISRLNLVLFWNSECYFMMNFFFEWSIYGGFNVFVFLLHNVLYFVWKCSADNLSF